MARWTEYIHELLEGSENVPIEGETPLQVQEDFISKTELSDAIGKMKMGKATGEDA